MKHAIVITLCTLLLLHGKAQTIGAKVGGVMWFDMYKNFPEQVGGGPTLGFFYDQPIYKRLEASIGLDYSQAIYKEKPTIWFADFGGKPQSFTTIKHIAEVPICLQLRLNKINAKWKVYMNAGYRFGVSFSQTTLTRYDNGSNRWKTEYPNSFINGLNHSVMLGFEVRRTISKRCILSIGTQMSYNFTKGNFAAPAYDWRFYIKFGFLAKSPGSKSPPATH